jgi:hypothetical protein
MTSKQHENASNLNVERPEPMVGGSFKGHNHVMPMLAVSMWDEPADQTINAA